MRKLYYTLIFSIFLAACGKDNKGQVFQKQGTLTGIDLRRCACCGGVFLTIDNDPAQYRVQSLAGMTWHEINSLQFPRRIEFSFTTPPATCGSDQLLDISDYVLR